MSRINERWENGVPHNEKSIALVNKLSEYDWKYLDGYFDWKTGGDGDNGETLMYLLDCIFEDEAPSTESPGETKGRAE